LAIWRDLIAQPVRQYQELPPFVLLQLLNLDPRATDQSEYARAVWFWLHRPKLILGDGWLPSVLGAVCAVLFPIIPFIGSPLTFMSDVTIAYDS
jgi:hypothetical protein